MESYWLKNIHNSIKDISDLAFQRKAWFGKSKYVSSFSEVINTLYDDNCFDDFLNEEFWKSEECRKQKVLAEMQKLNLMINSYEEPNGDENIIVDKGWIEITKQALVVIKLWESNKISNGE